MDNEGVSEKLISLIYIRNGLQKNIGSADIGRTYSEKVLDVCGFLMKIRQTGDFEAMLEAEKTLVAEDIERALSREPRIAAEMQRMERVEDQLVSGLKCYEQLARDTGAYQNSVEYYAKKAPDGYPRDSCREFLGSQSARLRDLLKQPDNKEQVAVLEARKASLEEMKKLYKALQKELLPEPVRGAEAIKRSQKEAEKDWARLRNRKDP